MPWVRLNNFEYAGYVADVDAHLLPPNTLSSLQNGRVDDGVFTRYPGYSELPAAPTDPILYLLSGGFGNNAWLVAATKDKIYSVTLAAASDITPSGGLSSVSYNDFSGGVLHGIAVLTNGIERPVYWNGTGNFNTITNWPASASCKMLRPFKNFLIAGNISDGSGDYPTKLLWSTAADPGALPVSWAEGDPTKDSGSVTLSDTPGEIVDGIQSGDSFFIYKEDAVYELQYIGGTFIFSLKPRFYNFRALARNCAISHRNKVYVLSADDVVVHTQSEMQSIATKAVRRRLFNEVSRSYLTRSFVTYDNLHGEIMFCVPWYSDTPDHAFMYNPTTGKWGERDLPQVGAATIGKFFTEDTIWDTDSQSWDSDTTSWGFLPATASYTFLGGQGLYGLNETWGADGAGITSAVERRSIDFGDAGDAKERIKFVSVVRPNIIAAAGVQVQVQIGTQMKLGDAVNWGTAQTFIVGTTRDLHFRANGRYISWRVQATGQDPWKLESIDLDVRMGAMW